MTTMVNPADGTPKPLDTPGGADGTLQPLEEPAMTEALPENSQAASIPNGMENGTDSRPLARGESVKAFYLKHTYAVLSVIGVILTGVASFVLATALCPNDSCGKSPAPKPAPTPAPTPDPTPAPPPPERREYLTSLIKERSNLTDVSFKNPAFYWIFYDNFSREWPSQADKDLDDRMLQRFALVSLYYSTYGDNWTNHDGGQWLEDSDSDECKWNSDDIVCSDGSLVERIHLEGDNLSGRIPIEIGLLTELTYLNLGDNQLEESIPNELGVLTSLTALYLCTCIGLSFYWHECYAFAHTPLPFSV
jgi:Leucine-rich repeat (LRR) protein